MYVQTHVNMYGGSSLNDLENVLGDIVSKHTLHSQEDLKDRGRKNI